MKAGVMILLLTGCTRRTEIHMDGLREESFSETEQERQTEEQTGVSSVIYVYVCGAVQAPGVYALQDGMRVYEALAAAGGLSGRCGHPVAESGRTGAGRGSGYMYIRRKRYRHLQRMLRRRQAASREEMRHTKGST